MRAQTPTRRPRSRALSASGERSAAGLVRGSLVDAVDARARRGC